MGLFEFQGLRRFLSNIRIISQNVIEKKRLLLILCIVQLVIIADYLTLVSDEEVVSNLFLGMAACTALFVVYTILSIVRRLNSIGKNSLILLQPIVFFVAISSLPIRLLAESIESIALFHAGYFTSLFSSFFLLYFSVQGGMFIPTDRDQMLAFLKYYSKRDMVLTMVPISVLNPIENRQILDFRLRRLGVNETDVINSNDSVFGDYSLVNAAFCIPMALRKVDSAANANIRDVEPATARSLERLKRDGDFQGKLESGFIDFEDNSSAFMLLFVLASKERWTLHSGDKLVDRRSLANKNIGSRIIHFRLTPDNLSRAAIRLLSPNRFPIVKSCFDYLMHSVNPEERLKIRNYLILLSRLGVNNDYNEERWIEMVRSYCEMMANPTIRKRDDIEWFHCYDDHIAFVLKSSDTNQPYQLVLDGFVEESSMSSNDAIKGAMRRVDANISSIIRKLFEESGIYSWESRMDEIARSPVENFIQHHDDIQRFAEEEKIGWIDLDEVISKITSRIHSIKLRNPITNSTNGMTDLSSLQGSTLFSDSDSVKMRALINRRKGVVVGIAIGMETLNEMMPNQGV